MTLPSHLPRHALCLLLLLGSASFGCQEDDGATEIQQELEERLAEHTTIFHVGCDSWNRCDDGQRSCGETSDDDIIQEANSAMGTVVEAEPASSPVRPTYYWFINADGSGTHYWQQLTDVQGDNCGDYCGWHRESFKAGVLIDSDSKLNYAGGDGALLINEWPNRDDEACDWQ